MAAYDEDSKKRKW